MRFKEGEKMKKSPLLLIILWITIIFLFSNMKGIKSDSASKGFIYKTVEIGFTILNKDLTPNELEIITNRLNYPFRKCMHASVYFILSIFIINAFREVKMDNWKKYMYAILFCFLWAILDETHQLYVDGRTGQMIDVWIDTIGSILWVIIVILFRKVKKQES